MNVIGYIRVSTAGQAKDGYSLAYQREEIEAYCKQQGWNLICTFADEGISSAKVDEDAMELDRQGFRDMLNKIAVRLEIAMKLGKGRNEKAKKGSKQLEIDAEQAVMVERVFELRELFPEWTLSEIAFQLNLENCKTQQGKSFTKVQVKRILDLKAFYSGMYRYASIESIGLHQAII